jgi:hypothetical protein
MTRVPFRPGDIVGSLHRGQRVGDIAIVRECTERFCTADPWPVLDEPDGYDFPLFDCADQFYLIRPARPKP